MGSVGVSVAVEEDFSRNLEKITGDGTEPSMGDLSFCLTQALCEFVELFSEHRVYGAFGRGKREDLPEVRVHSVKAGDIVVGVGKPLNLLGGSLNLCCGNQGTRYAHEPQEFTS